MLLEGRTQLGFTPLTPEGLLMEVRAGLIETDGLPHTHLFVLQYRAWPEVALDIALSKVLLKCYGRQDLHPTCCERAGDPRTLLKQG